MTCDSVDTVANAQGKGIAMMRGRWAIAFLGACIAAGQAGAQGVGATDNELYAAYCIGVIRNAEAQPGQPASDPKLEEKLRAGGAAMRQQLLRRFSGYLAATGIMIDPARSDALIGLYAAMTRGAADNQQATATSSACQKSLDGESNNRAWANKYAACEYNDPAFNRVVRCVQPDSLPF